MHLLDLTLPTPEENLALDEALLTAAESTGTAEVLRIWHPTSHFVVLGRGSKATEEVDLEFCRSAGIPLLRRTSGGASILTGPGCLMYAVVVSTAGPAAVDSIDATHARALRPLAAQLSRAERRVRRAGISDLVIEPAEAATLSAWQKISGNSLRRKRTHILYHGTILFDFDLLLLDRCLKTPPRMPAYREQRDHQQFVTNLDLPEFDVRQAIQNSWPIDGLYTSWPQSATAALAAEKYASPDWTLRH